MRLICSLVLAGLLVAAGSAGAQTYRTERPYRGLFGNGLQDPQQSLTATGSAGGGWDNNVAADALFGEESPTSELDRSVRGGVVDGSGAINYLLNLPALSMGASASTAVHYYPSLKSQWLRRYYGDVNANAKVTRDLSVNGSVEYAPYSLSSLFPFTGVGRPDQTVIPNVDLTSSLEHYFTYGGGATYSHHLSRRAVISADYSIQLRDKTTFSQQYTHNRAGGAYTFTIARGVALRAGYHYDDVDYGTTSHHFRNHQIDAGIDYNRTLSFSRRTSLAFHTGTSAISSGTVPDAHYTYTLTGGASLNHEFGRTWNANAAYERGVNVDPAWADLVRSDSASATLNGLISRRLNVGATARASTGHVGAISTAGNGFESYFGDASLGYALGRHVSLGASYTYYRHRFDRDVPIPLDFSNTFNRHSIRMSVSVWAPIVQRARSSNATR